MILKWVIRRYLLLIFIISMYPAISMGWELKRNDSDIEIYYREVERKGVFFTEFKAITNIDTNLSTLATVLRDVESLQEWVYMVESAEAKKINEFERYTHIMNKKPFPFFSKRDSVVHSTIQQDKTTLIVTIRGTASPDSFCEKIEGIVRIMSGEAMWQFVPIGENNTEVIFQGFGDPGGNLNFFIIKSLVKNELWKMPFESLKGLKKQVNKGKYRINQTPFIKNFASNEDNSADTKRRAAD